mgnify:CR=1 FL=1
MLWKLNLGPLVEQVAGEDAQAVGAQVLVGCKVGVAKLLFDRAYLRVNEESRLVSWPR